MGYEEQLSRYVLSMKTAPLDADALQSAIRFVQDSYGVGLSGSRVPHVSALKASALDRLPEAHVWNTGERGSAASVAMINAYQIHNQEWDCVHEPAVVHPMAVILSVLTAAAERAGDVSGEAFLRAVIVAVDVAAVLGMCTNQPMRFFRPGWCGGLGAIAGLAILLDASESALKNAWGIAYSGFGGTMQAHREGSSTLPLQIAFNARHSILAFDLATAGIDGPQSFLSGDFGFFKLIESSELADKSFSQLGKTWQISSVSHKPFPTGRAAHGGLDGITQLRAQHEFSVTDIASVTLEAPPLIHRLVGREVGATMNPAYARLCFPYLAATLLLQGSVDVSAYDDECLRDEERLALAQKVRLAPDGNKDPNALSPQALEIALHSGTTHRIELPAVLGAPDRPLSDEQHRSKFDAATGSAINPLSIEESGALFDVIQSLADTDLINLFALLRGQN